MCHALEIRFETTHQTSLTSAGCRSQTSLHINLFVFFFLFFFLNLVCEDLSDEAGGSFCWWQSATFLLFSLFSQFYCLQLRYARRHHTWWLIAGEKKRKKLWAMVCLAAPLHNGSGAGMLLMPSGDIGKNRNLIEERTRREMTGDFLACCSPLRKSSGTS